MDATATIPRVRMILQYAWRYLVILVGERQVFEIKVPSLADEMRTTKVVEVRWTRPLPVNVHTTMHLAGVKFLFEPPSN